MGSELDVATATLTPEAMPNTLPQQFLNKIEQKLSFVGYWLRPDLEPAGCRRAILGMIFLRFAPSHSPCRCRISRRHSTSAIGGRKSERRFPVTLRHPATWKCKFRPTLPNAMLPRSARKHKTFPLTNGSTSGSFSGWGRH
jgi:hypothetical protein